MNGASDQLLHLFSGYNQIAVLRCLLDLLMHVHLALLVSMFYLIEITTLFLLENSGSTVCKFHRFKRKLAITLGYFHPGWCVCVTQVISFRKS